MSWEGLEIDKALVILSDEVKTPPLSHEARREIGFLIRTDPDSVLVVAIFSKKTGKTPKPEIERAKRLLREYDAD